MSDNFPYPASRITLTDSLATTLFGTPPGPERAAEEDELLQKGLRLSEVLAVQELYGIAPKLDALASRLSGYNRLKFVRTLQDRSDAIVQNMQIGRSMLAHLQTAHELSEVLSPAAIERMRRGLEELCQQELAEAENARREQMLVQEREMHERKIRREGERARERRQESYGHERDAGDVRDARSVRDFDGSTGLDTGLDTGLGGDDAAD